MSDRSPVEQQADARTVVPREQLQIHQDERWRKISSEAIQSIVHQIAERFRPERIILFGSYASGLAGPASDVDLLVVMDTPLKEIDQAVLICQKIEYHWGLDLIVRTPTTLARRLALGDPFILDAIHKGKVLYERSSR